MTDNNRHMQARLYTGNLYMHQSHSWPIGTKCHNINNSQYKPFNAKYGLFSAICVMHVECIKSNAWLHDDMVFTNQQLLHD